MLTESSVTIYNVRKVKGQLEPLFTRVYLAAVHFEEELLVSIDTNGYNSADRVKVFVPTDTELEVNKGDYLVKGEHPSVSSSDDIKALKTTERVYVIKGITNRLYGSKRLQHVEIEAV